MTFLSIVLKRCLYFPLILIHIALPIIRRSLRQEPYGRYYPSDIVIAMYRTQECSLMKVIKKTDFDSSLQGIDYTP